MKTKRIFTLMLALVLFAGLIPQRTEAAGPKYDSEEVIYLTQGQDLIFPESFDHPALPEGEKLDYTDNPPALIYGEMPPITLKGEPSVLAVGVEYSYMTDYVLYDNPEITGNAIITGAREEPYVAYVEYHTKPSNLRFVHKATFYVTETPHTDVTRTVTLTKGTRCRGEMFVPPSSVPNICDVAFPVPASAWIDNSVCARVEIPGVSIMGDSELLFDGVRFYRTSQPGLYYVPGRTKDENNAIFYEGTATSEGEHQFWFRVSPTRTGHHFKPYTCLVTFKVTGEAEKEYDLWIDGKRVTGMNLNNVTGDGAFAFDPETNTLHIAGSHTSKYTGGAVVVSGIDGLTIQTDKDAVITAGGDIFELEHDTAFTGEGKLTITSTGGCGITVSSGATVSLNNKMKVTGDPYAISGWGSETLVIGADLDTVGMVGGFGELTPPGESPFIDTLEVTTPKDGKIAGGEVTDSEGHAAESVSIRHYRTYKLILGDRLVTDKNRNNILAGVEGGDGKFSYDPQANTLQIKGSFKCPEDWWWFINNGIPGLTVQVYRSGLLEFELEAGNPDIPLIYTYADMTIQGRYGSNQLTLKGATGEFGASILVQDAALTIKDIILIAGSDEAGTAYAIEGRGNSSLTVDFCEIHATIDSAALDPSVSETAQGAIFGFSGGITLKDCRIEYPYTGWASGGAIITSYREPVAEVRIGKKPKVVIGDTTTKDHCVVQVLSFPMEDWQGKVAVWVAAYDRDGRMIQHWRVTRDLQFSTACYYYGTADIAEYRAFLVDMEKTPLAPCAVFVLPEE
ncbi:MAG: hypothetical protein K5981_07390 [Clostridia bacterium]|nr:hypothetical protein [Clostridia bacterium]